MPARAAWHHLPDLVSAIGQDSHDEDTICFYLLAPHEGFRPADRHSLPSSWRIRRGTARGLHLPHDDRHLLEALADVFCRTTLFRAGTALQSLNGASSSSWPLQSNCGTASEGFQRRDVYLLFAQVVR